MKQVPLSQGKIATVDDEDFERVSALRWHVNSDEGYAAHSYREGGKTKKLKLHRFVLGLEKFNGMYVDHINRNTLDCRKSNLRLCTRSQNNANSPKQRGTSSYKGVYRSKSGKNPWRSKIMVNYKKIDLGSFPTETEAARAYNTAARAAFGEFAYVNPV